MSDVCLTIDGSIGEGGGQILRSALALSVCLKKPFQINNIRAKRKKPGLLRQHLTAVKAATRISNATVEGDTLGSQILKYEPQEVQSGEYHFSIGTAGSTTLVLQTILLPLLFGKGESKVSIEGGTHNPMAPPFGFIQHAFIPVLEKMGASIKLELVRPGFFPAGGGVIEVTIEPIQKLDSITIMERGKLIDKKAQVLISNLPMHIAEREAHTLKRKLNWTNNSFETIEYKEAYGSANVISIMVKHQHVTEVFTGFGERGLKAEKVATKIVKEVKRYLDSETPVDEYLADQLLLPMALAKKGKFVTCEPSQHSLTNMDVISTFMDINFSVTKITDTSYEISVQ